MNNYINTYNFVPLGKKAKCSQYVRSTDEQALTGKIDCTLTIKTPLAILDSETKTVSKNGHTTYKFFSVNGKSIIPGSLLRGIIYNVYGIITDSCFSVVNSNSLSIRFNAGDHKFKPGLIRFVDGNRKLYEAYKCSRFTESTKQALKPNGTDGIDYVER